MASNDPFDINNDGKFFLLKTKSMSELGSRDSDGNPVTFFLPNNIGVIQSTALLQQLNQTEFKASETQPNTSFINFLSTGTFETSGLVFARYNWTVDSSDPFKTQQNFANATLSNCAFFKGSNQKSLEVGWDGAFNSTKTNGDKLFSDIIIELSLHISPASTVSLDNASVKEFIEGMLVSNYTEVSGGGDTNLTDIGSNNIIDAINRIISRSNSTRNSMIEDPNAACTFEQIDGKMKNLESSFEAYVGKVFSEGAAQELFNITKKSDAYSAIIQNYELISGQSFSGLIDTPTGHIGGMYLLSNGSGIVFTGIDKIAEDLLEYGLGFTGLKDTPTGYLGHSNQYLVVNDNEDGVSFTGIDKIAEDLLEYGFETITDFTGLKDTPTGYLGHSNQYLVVNDNEDGVSFTGIDKIAEDLLEYGFNGDIPRYTNLPDATENDGKIVANGCDLYYSCDGEWKKIGADSIPPPEGVPGCVNSLEEYNEYQEYKERFLADNMGSAAESVLNNGTRLSDLTLDVCLFPESNLKNEKNTVVIDETKYKWGIFESPQTINLSAVGYSDQTVTCVFREWVSSNVTFEDSTSANTSVFVDTDSSIIGRFDCFSPPGQPSCSEILFHLQSNNDQPIDKSTYQRPIENTNNVVSSNDQQLFGGSTFDFTSAQGAIVTEVVDISSPEINGFEAITTEVWINLNNLGVNQGASQTIFEFAGVDRLRVNGSTNNPRPIGSLFWERGASGGNSAHFFPTDVSPLNINQWYHIAVVYTTSNKTLKVYLDGIQIALIEPISFLLLDGNWRVGGPSGFIKGYLQDFRVSKKEVYTSNFTPPNSLLNNPC